MDGLIKVRAVSPPMRVADVAFNVSQLIEAAKKAQAGGVQLVVFPELAITGYTCGDLFLQKSLLQAAEDALLRLAEATKDTAVLLVVGVPWRVRQKLYNCAAVVQGGEILGLVPKTFVPNYSEFYELRHFTPAPKENITLQIGEKPVIFGTKQLFCCKEQADFVLGVEICEDLWAPIPPSSYASCAGATVIANLSASNEMVGKSAYRRKLVEGQSARLLCSYVYCDANAGESTTDLVFSGHHLIAENGALAAEATPFSGRCAEAWLDLERLVADRRRMTTFQTGDDGYEKVFFTSAEGFAPENVDNVDKAVDKYPFIPQKMEKRAARCEELLALQAHGLKKRLEHTGCSTVVLGISGGLDSTLALLAVCKAFDLLQLDRKGIIAVTMPCFGTTDRTYQNAVQLIRELHCTFREIRINKSVEQHFADIGHAVDVHDVTFENAQARERTQVLMDVANQHGGLVIGTGDLSELALGWATYNGDHMSMYGVNASVPKTLVRHMVQHVADGSEPAVKAVLEDILDTPVSPELLPPQEGKIAQKTEDLVGPYALHDFFLFYCVRYGYAPKKIFAMAKKAFTGEYDGQTILKWLKTFYRRFFSQQFKRSCLPDGPKVGSVSLSPRGDWRMPSDACVALWLQEVETLEREEG